MSRVCPICKCPVEDEANFCAECGAELTGHPAEEPKLMSGSADITLSPPCSDVTMPSSSAVDFGRLAAQIGQPRPMTGSSWNLAARSLTWLEDELPTQGNNELQVEYCDELFFVAGAQAPFQLRVTVLRPGLRAFWVWCVPRGAAGSQMASFEVPVEELPRQNRPMLIEVPFLPSQSAVGLVSFQFYFCCQYEEHSVFWLLRAQHQVYASESALMQNAPHITINAQSGQASDTIVNLGGLESYAGRGLTERLDELRRQMVLKSKVLEETSWRPERLQLPGESYRCDRLTVEFGGRLVHLVALAQVRLGRNPDLNDIVVAELQVARSLAEYPNNTVSRRHAQIHYCGDSVNLFDTSSSGTLINGVRPDGQGMRIPSEAEIAFGAIRWQMSMQRCELRPNLASCRNCLARKVKCIVFTRTDKIPEAFVLLWQCCDLGRLDHRLEGFTLLRRNDGFLLREADGQLHQLVPDTKIKIANQQIFQVRRFHQYGL